MKITNKTTKIIGIAGKSVLPNESTDIPDSEANSSVVQHFADIGKILLGDEAVPNEPAPGEKKGKSSVPPAGDDNSGKKAEPPKK